MLLHSYLPRPRLIGCSPLSRFVDDLVDIHRRLPCHDCSSKGIAILGRSCVLPLASWRGSGCDASRPSDAGGVQQVARAASKPSGFPQQAPSNRHQGYCSDRIVGNSRCSTHSEHGISAVCCVQLILASSIALCYFASANSKVIC